MKKYIEVIKGLVNIIENNISKEDISVFTQNEIKSFHDAKAILDLKAELKVEPKENGTPVLTKEMREFLLEIQGWMFDNDYECGEHGSQISNDINKLLGESFE